MRLCDGTAESLTDLHTYVHTSLWGTGASSTYVHTSLSSRFHPLPRATTFRAMGTGASSHKNGNCRLRFYVGAQTMSVQRGQWNPLTTTQLPPAPLLTLPLLDPDDEDSDSHFWPPGSPEWNFEASSTPQPSPPSGGSSDTVVVRRSRSPRGHS